MMTRLRVALMGCLLVLNSVVPAHAQAQSAEARALAQASDLVRGRDWDGALAAARNAGPYGRDVILWHWLREGRGEFSDYQDFLSRNADWPGLPMLQRLGEPSIPPGANPDEVIAFFDGYQVEDGLGALRLANAYADKGMMAEAGQVAARAWRTLSLTAEEQTQLYTRYSDALSDAHTDRLTMLLDRERFAEAERMYTLVSDGWQALAKARIALVRDENGVDALISAVPSSLRDDPGLAYDRFRWRLAKGYRDSAIDLMLEQGRSDAGLGDGTRWAGRRVDMVRDFMRDGNGQMAYRLASEHGLEPGDGYTYAELEWLAGYAALYHQKDPAKALTHFQTFRLAVDTPISLGRAGYWEGRALEALGRDAEARVAYEYGAEFQTSFYGLLSAERIGLPMDPALMGTETFPDWRGAWFTQSSVFKAAVLLHEAGELPLSARFFRHLGESLNATELGQLADFVATLDEPYLQVLVAKFAADQGVVLNRAYYPVGKIKLDGLPIPPELALAITRRESEFNPDVISHAGARGLMQLMPRTGEAMAKELGISGFQTDDLLNKPDLNVRLGSAYLAKLTEEFDGAMMMIAAGYNAGPSRPQRWMEAYGDPRKGQIDPVDWIEHIPFDETRNYIMRVMESLPVYRARLHGKVEPLRLMDEMVGR